ncbi:PAS domain-containing protein [Paenibacillus sp. LMG 31458]|uniref:histidine kinase n=1 Tax=Paenibacillus phytorum TaxID=2654977 RepID=A0ABX1Y1W0_9BACL|nr:PAS domain-containing sensor histidine kinase [Paenibacillus phytorum]NOU74594.1 PAS domain-containing protein [Paenibacillus phytorum]
MNKSIKILCDRIINFLRLNVALLLALYIATLALFIFIQFSQNSKSASLWMKIFDNRLKQIEEKIDSKSERIPYVNYLSIGIDGTIDESTAGFLKGIKLNANGLFAKINNLKPNEVKIIIYPDMVDGIQRVHFVKRYSNHYVVYSFDAKNFFPEFSISDSELIMETQGVIWYSSNSRNIGNGYEKSFLSVKSGQFYMTISKGQTGINHTSIVVVYNITFQVEAFLASALLLLAVLIGLNRRIKKILGDFVLLKSEQQSLGNFINTLSNNVITRQVNLLSNLVDANTVNRDFIRNEREGQLQFEENKRYKMLIEKYVDEILFLFDTIQSQSKILETTIENISDAFTVYDNQGKLILINAEARKLYHMFDEIKNIENVYDALEYFDMQGNIIPQENHPIFRALRGEKVRNDLVIIRQPDKEQITEINATPVYEEDGNFAYVALFHRDITEIYENQMMFKRQQEQLLHNEIEKNEALQKAMQMKDEFFALVSHEFRTPIGVISAAIQAMEFKCKDELSQKARGYLNMIRLNSNRQLKLVNNILDLTHAESGNMRIVKKNVDIIKLSESITDSVRTYTEQKGIKLLFTTTIEEMVVGIDVEKYERILLNLLSNAIKFTTSQKTVIVKISRKIVRGKYNLSIQVKDQGIGIPIDKQKIIFERFGQADSSLTRPAEGTGLGLTLVKMIVELMGGAIQLESKENRGAKFIVLFPMESVQKIPMEQIEEPISDVRLLQASAIEFSDVYV